MRRSGPPAAALLSPGSPPATGPHDPPPHAPSAGAIGPLWLGPLAAPAILSSLPPAPPTGFAAARIVDRMREEVALPPFFFENNETARRAGVDPRPLPTVLEGLRAHGRRAAPTLFRENAFKTDLPASELLDLYRALGP